MPTLSVSLPEELKTWIDAEVRRGGYAGAAEYVRDLIRSDRKTKAEDILEGAILRGFESGPAREMKARDWRALRERVGRRVRIM